MHPIASGVAAAEPVCLGGKLTERLDIAGIDLLGVGYSGFVYGPRVADHVVKVGFDPADPWPQWAAWCRANPGPHVPVVHDLTIVTHRGRRAGFVAVMERLAPCPAMRAILKSPDGIARRLKARPPLLADAVRGRWPTLATLLGRIDGIFPGTYFDMAASNWLERPDETPVLTDPLARAISRPPRGGGTPAPAS